MFLGIGFILLIILGSLFGPLLQMIEGLSK
jgi:hypothetical protein